MRRGTKPAKAKSEAKPPIARKALKSEGSRVHDLDRRLAEAVKREAEALEQQRATAEILRVMSSSLAQLQPVLDAIAERAARPCDASNGTIILSDGEALRMEAHYGPLAEQIGTKLPIDRRTVSGRAFLEGRPLHVDDLSEAADFPLGRQMAARFGIRTFLAVPLVREAVPIGLITMQRTEVRPFSDKQIELLKTFADQAVIAIENVRLFAELQERNRVVIKAHAQVSETLEQQTATSEILRVISSSPTDLQPVFEAIVTGAARLCDAIDGTILLFDGDTLVRVAHEGPISSVPVGPFGPLTPGRPSARAVLEARTIHVVDLQAEVDEYPEGSALARSHNFRTVLNVPLVRAAAAIGVIAIRRTEARPFTERQTELLQTFADQAVIAIENVRLFKELEEKNRALTESHAQVTEALEQQTATGEILRVISQSQTDVQPVFDTIVRSAVRLCDGLFSALYQFDGEVLRQVAQHNFTPEALEEVRRISPVRPTRALGGGRAILERAVVLIPDVENDPEYPDKAVPRAIGFRSGLFVPMLREGAPIGVIMVARAEPGPFSDNEIELLKTFADQAVIAVENVRLFTELQTSNRELTTALDKQTATSDILRAISRSQTDVQPVFDAILASAVRLLGAYSGVLTRIAGDQIVLAALTSSDDAGDAATRALFPQPLQSELSKAGQWDKMAAGYAQTIRERAPLNIADAHTDPRWPETARAYARVRGYRSWVAVPMLRHDGAIGTISVTRREPGGFTDDEIALLQTFADQAVIAIENARLLSELQARTQELTRSVDQLTALGDVGRAVSSSLDLDTVLNTIVGRAVQLTGADGGTIFEYEEIAEEFSARATLNADEGQSAMLRSTRLRRGEGAVGQMAVTREPVQIPDIAAEGAYESRIRRVMLAAGTRSVLAIPLLHEDRLVGGLVVTRRVPGEFTDDVVELLKTFATQSALAIQNARLFREIADKSAQLEAASRHKSEFLANMSHELRTPLNAIIGFSEILAEKMFGDINEKQTEYLQDILESGRHLLSLINDILDLSKIEAGRMELELSEFHLPTAIDNALILVRERASRRGIKLGSTIDERLGVLSGDERKVKQVLLNLLSNALKFTPEGGRIDVRAWRDDGMAEISVMDTGIGIAPADQEAVFEEFRQVGTADKKAEGTGLGLALSRKFIELHGGRVWVESEVGRGSTFTFTLPVR
jgi:GAF domain-containing protein